MSNLPIPRTLLDWGFADAHIIRDISPFAVPLLVGRTQLCPIQGVSYHHIEERRESEFSGGTTAFIGLLKQALTETVDARRKRIFALRYGWAELPPQSFEAIGTAIGVCGQNATKLHLSTTRKLWIAGMHQLAQREPQGACGRLQHLLQDAIRPKDEGAKARVVQFAATHLADLPQKRIAQPLIFHLVLLSPRRDNVLVGNQNQTTDTVLEEGDEQ